MINSSFFCILFLYFVLVTKSKHFSTEILITNVILLFANLLLYNSLCSMDFVDPLFVIKTFEFETSQPKALSLEFFLMHLAKDPRLARKIGIFSTISMI